MKYTTNYNFKKPELPDTVNLEDFNQTFDLVDTELKRVSDDNEHLEATFNQLTINAGTSNAEIVDARVSKDNVVYAKFGDRMDDFETHLADIVLNPKNFGAKADGVTDDTVALQNCINSKSKAIIDLGGYSYKINVLDTHSNITIRNGTLVLDNIHSRLRIIGDRVIIKDLSIDAGTLVCESQLLLHLATNITLDNIKFTGTGGGQAIYCKTKASNVVIKGLYVPFIGYGVLFDDQHDRTVDGVSYTDSIGSGLHIYDSIFGDLNKVNYGDGVEINAPLNGFSNVIIQNCDVIKAVPTGSSDGMGFGFSTCSNVKIISNTLMNCTDNGAIHFEYCNSVKVIDNYLSNNTRAIMFIETKDIVIKNNSLLLNWQDISCYNTSQGALGSNFVKIEDNYIEQSTHFSILLGGLQYASIKNNVINRFKGTTSTSIIQIDTLIGIGINYSEIVGNKIIRGSDGVDTSSIFHISAESHDNIIEDNLFLGYTAKIQMSDLPDNNRIRMYIRGNGRTFYFAHSNGSPQGYLLGKVGALAVDEAGNIYKCTGSVNWTKIL